MLAFLMSMVQGQGPPLSISPGFERLVGVQIPIDPANAFVLAPLSIPAQTNIVLADAIQNYKAASPAQRQTWANNFATALDKAPWVNGEPVVARGDYGPVPVMMAALDQ